MTTWTRNYALGLVLATLFLVAWAVHLWAGWHEFQLDALAHGHADVPWHAYAWTFTATTAENWQSEFLQLATMVVLTRWLIFRGSPQSKDGSERLEAKVDQLLRLQRRDEEAP